MSRFLTAALYKFVSLPDFAELRQPLFEFCQARSIKGTLLLAAEGINGTVAGPETGIRELLAHLRADPRLSRLEHKESWSDKEPFYRLKVKLKKEIVTLGVDGIDPNRMAGHYVKPQDWNRLIQDPEVVLIDTRNDYEYQVGTFEGAINPQTRSFTQLPAWVECAPAASRRFITSKAASSNTWSRCLPAPAPGRANALCLTSGSRLVTISSPAALSCAAPAVTR